MAFIKFICILIITVSLIITGKGEDTESVLSMQKHIGGAEKLVTLKRIIRDVETGSGETATDEEQNILRKHTDVHVFSNDSNPSISLIWTGTEGALIALTTMGNGITLIPSRLYRSSNFGRSFVDISDKIEHDRILNNHGMLVSPVDSNNVMLVTDQSFSLFARGMDYRSVVYITTDNGQSFSKSKLKFIIDPSSVYFNKYDTLKILAISSDNHGLWISYDFGLVWRHISDHVIQVRWDPTDKDTFYYAKDPTGSMISGAFNNELYRGKASYIESTKIAEHIYSFGVQGGFIFISVEFLSHNGSRVMHVSKDKGVTWDAAQIPLINKQQFYSLLDMSEDMVFVHVDADGGSGDGSIYTSDERGIIYSKSLDHHLYPSLGSVTDFYKVSSLEGVYITSQLEHQGSTIHSMITYNKGGTWQNIDSPKNSVCPPTEKVCFLQIHSLFSRSKGVAIPEFPKSSASATGIIIAHGNIGDALNFNTPDVYISNDGGYSWLQPPHLKGPQFYAIGDSGGLLFAVNYSKSVPTNVIKYSMDEGQSWEEYKFVDSPILVTGLSVEPGSRSTSLGLWGWDKSGDGAWRSITMDFSAIMKKPCQKSDYQDWKAHESNKEYGEDSCLLGADVIFNRRKKGTVCINGKQYQNAVTLKPCQCQKTDYLCDYGYVREGFDCVRDGDFQATHIDICKKDQDEIIKTKGYRKIPGDKCQGGFTPNSQVIPLHKKCKPSEEKKDDFGVDKDNFSQYHPSGETKKSTSPGVIVFLVFVVVVLILALVYIVRKRQMSGKRVKYVPLPTSEHAASYGTGAESNSLMEDGAVNGTTPRPNGNSSISYHDDSDEDMLIS
ncbi:sortilin-like [Styela clava]